MKARTRTLVLLIAALLFLGACAAAGPAQPGGGKKILASEIKYDQLWLAVLPVMTRRFDIKEIDKAKGYIKATQSHWGMGEHVALFIRPLEGMPYAFEVEVISTRKGWDPRKWDDEVLADLKGRVGRGSKKERDGM